MPSYPPSAREWGVVAANETTSFNKNVLGCVYDADLLGDSDCEEDRPNQPLNGDFVTYRSDSVFHQQDSFSYLVTDHYCPDREPVDSAVVTVTVTISARPANYAPATKHFGISLKQNRPMAENDLDDDTQAVSSFSQSSDGTVSESPNRLTFPRDSKKDSCVKNSFRAAHNTLFWDECVEFTERFVNTAKKCKGAAAPPPPAFGWSQAVHSFFGCFATLLMLTYLNKVLVGSGKGDTFALILGPFGALVTLIYGLTSSPAAQPRNAVLGQLVSIIVVILMRSLPMDREVRISLSVALAIGVMCKLGVIHPPAGASAMVFASSDTWGFSHMGILLVGNLLTILAAAFINNWSEQRQYPTYWFGDIHGQATNLLERLQNICCQSESPMKGEDGETEDSGSLSDFGELQSLDIVVNV